ncbi:glycoside hydrolase family 15 protein [Loktanella sp. SALINAS62]|uniref:glycoside hydrolase family 15 protein n=1 Tax=Loktanella sp. SALINAS62 TaxID=2706124 RepID=UPI001B8D4C65|nr:glycoside hydrolase family 15 protein [Loktanella sp. SALINAS62]MBS1303312.1 glycoside hydrolase family 15 protein [Loktanella sp. SALINAS62]
MSAQKAISDYAMIGDCETAALVGRDGSIDWLCWPRFDSGACFAALLGTKEHGRWKIAPPGDIQRIERSYHKDTLILETTFETAEGDVSLIDFMPIRKDRQISDVVRLVVGRKGRVRMRMDLAFRFDYGRIVPWVTKAEGGRLRAVAGPHAVLLTTPVELRGEDLTTVAEFTVAAGQRIPFTLAYEASHLPSAQLCEPEPALEETENFWTGWVGKCRYDGPWKESVVRSLITVKALTFRPTGGVVAAATTSLPEIFGGVRNWDYRYCWLRDATFSLLSLIKAGYRAEAEAWGDWLLRAVAGAASQIQPLYGVAGEHRNDEVKLDWLPGFADSSPVRIGNLAYTQLQVDVFGSVMDTLYQARSSGLSLNEAYSGLLLKLMKQLEEVWRRPDEGIWEVRGGRQHFVHSKLMSWVAFDRAIRFAEEFGLQGPVDRWYRLRAEVRAEILERGYDAKRGAFVQAYGSKALDSALLLIPLVGFLPADDPRVASTADAIERELSKNGLLLRYDTVQAEDGLPAGEGAFLACSFWLADNKFLQGRREEGEALFERLLALRNDVGLMSEQYDVKNQVMAGNFPQAFSHFAMINAAFSFARHGSDTEEK